MSYEDMDVLLKANAKPEIMGVEEVKKYEFRNKWGVDDGSFFNYAAGYIQKQQGDNFYCLLTMTNHGP